MRYFLILIFVFNASAFGLSPHPVSIVGPRGETGEISIDVDGVWFDVSWDGKRLILEKADYQGPNKNEIVKYQPKPKAPPPEGVHLRAVVSVAIIGGGLWAVILTAIFGSWETTAWVAGITTAVSVGYTWLCLKFKPGRKHG